MYIRRNAFRETKNSRTIRNCRSFISRKAFSRVNTVFLRDSIASLVCATVADIKKKTQDIEKLCPKAGEEIDSIFVLIHVTRARIHPRAGLQAATATSRDRLPRTQCTCGECRVAGNTFSVVVSSVTVSTGRYNVRVAIDVHDETPSDEFRVLSKLEDEDVNT